MDSFDYIVISIGVILIAIGLFLFIAGKRDSSIANQVEGFGIKLNVSNPSIILIVLGIALVLVPRFMPSQHTTKLNKLNPQNSTFLQSENVNQAASETTQNQESSGQSSPQSQQQVETRSEIQREQTSTQVFFPSGNWFLSAYEENGMDLSNAIAGTIRFSQNNANQLEWYAQLEAMDTWGNYMNYFYQGMINSVPGGYTITVLNSNDPSFVRQPSSQLTMQMDDANTLHLEYFFNGSKLILHFTR